MLPSSDQSQKGQGNHAAWRVLSADPGMGPQSRRTGLGGRTPWCPLQERLGLGWQPPERLQSELDLGKKLGFTGRGERRETEGGNVSPDNHTQSHTREPSGSGPRLAFNTTLRAAHCLSPLCFLAFLHLK